MSIFHWLVSVVGQEVPLRNFRYHVCLNTLLAARLPFLFLICVLSFFKKKNLQIKGAATCFILQVQNLQRHL